MRRHAAASEDSASAARQNAEANEAFSSVFTDYARRQRRSQSGFNNQPHDDDPNRAAIDIDSHDKSKS
jgi:hypothetical protein